MQSTVRKSIFMRLPWYLVFLGFGLVQTGCTINASIESTATAQGTEANQPTALTLVIPTSSYGNVATPTLGVNNIASGDIVKIYSDPTCASLVSSTTATASDVELSIPTLTEGTYSFYFTVSNSVGTTTCSTNAISYTLDMTAPSAPSALVRLVPTAATANDATPTIQIAGVTIGDTIELFSDTTCTTRVGGSIVSASPADVTANALPGGSYTFYARATDPAGNMSSCSAANVSYTLDISPPAAPTSIAFQSTEYTPGYNPNPAFVISTVMVGDTINLYTDSMCTMLVGSHTVFGNPQQVIVTSELTTEGVYTFYATAVDQYGNSSACSTASISYDFFIQSKIRFETNYVEKTEGTADLTVTVVNSHPRPYPITVSLDTSGSTATNATHYTLGSSTVVIPANQSTASVTVGIPENGASDGIRYLQLNIVGADQDYHVVPDVANAMRVYISDNDAGGNSIVTSFSSAMWIQSLGMGHVRACAVSNNKLFCWGDSNSMVPANGLLGDGTNIHRSSPVAVDAATNYSKIVLGPYASCGLTTANKLKCWGHGNHVGDNSASARTSPVAVDAASDYAKIFMNSDYTGGQPHCGITTGNKLKCWGGTSGDGTGNQNLAPVAVDSAQNYSTVSLGAGIGCAITMTGTLKCWGERVGDGTSNLLLSPVIIDSGTDYAKVSVARGSGPRCGITSLGVLKCWGNVNGGMGFVGTGDGTSDVRLSPVVVDSGVSYSEVDVTDNAVCGITTSGVLKCWGGSFAWALFGTSGAISPTAVDSGTTYQKIVINDSMDLYGFSISACGLTTANKLKCWGSNLRGAMGIGLPNDSSYTPVQIVSENIASFILPGLNGYALTTSGGLISWGENQAGQLGTGRAGNRPAIVDPLNTYTKVALDGTRGIGLTAAGELRCFAGLCPNGSSARTPISFGTSYSYLSPQGDCAITTTGILKCWGRFSGTNTTNMIYQPAAVDSGNTYSSVVGTYTKCAITTSGELKCWGAYVGDGTSATRMSPVVIDSGTAYSKVAIDDLTGTRCAITSAGALKCWGANTYGEAGVGSTLAVLSPTVIDSGTNFSDVSTSFGRTCARKTTGALRCWGNLWGIMSGFATTYLGDGTTNTKTSPIDIDGGTLFSFSKMFSFGFRGSSCGVTTTGALKCWGSNTYGEIGWLGGSSDQASPTVIDSGTNYKTNVDAISLTDSTGCGVTATGPLKCWGFFQSGIGSASLGTGFYKYGATYTAPTVVDSGTNYNYVYASGTPISNSYDNGTSVVCAITTGGVLKCWGSAIHRSNGDPDLKVSPMQRVVGF